MNYDQFYSNNIQWLLAIKTRCFFLTNLSKKASVENDILVKVDLEENILKFGQSVHFKQSHLRVSCAAPFSWKLSQPTRLPTGHQSVLWNSMVLPLILNPVEASRFL